MDKNITYETAGPASIGSVSESVANKCPVYSWQVLLIKGLIYLAILGGILYVVKICYIWWQTKYLTTNAQPNNSTFNYQNYNIPTITRRDTADSSSLQKVPGTHYTYLEENVY